MNCRAVAAAVSILAAWYTGHSVASPVATETVVLGPFTGHYAKLHPDNVTPYRIRYYGTDLGWTYKHRGQLHILFGDTWATEDTYYIEESTGRKFDDGFGTIDLEKWPDATVIGPDNIPLIKLGQHAGSSEMAAIDPGHALEGYKVPVGGFSNGEREFGVFYISKPEACMQDDDCNNGLTCDNGLGYNGTEPYDEAGHTLACMDGTEDCNPDPLKDADGTVLADSGLCINRTSSNWSHSETGRISGMALRHLAGMRSTEDPRKYLYTREWLTTKFINPAVRTVQDFVSDSSTGHDYRPAGGSGENRRVFLWGRPGFVGVGATGRDLGLYFAYVDMPSGTDFSWDVHYYTGTDENGVPQFSRDEKEAAALDLDAGRPGVQSEESHDIVDQMSIAWIDHLDKWVMFFGGGMINEPRERWPDCGLIEFFTGPECKQVVIGNGAMRMRTADNPWGPWTPPQDIFVGGDPDAVPPEHQYAEGGILYHPGCSGSGCVTPSGRRREDSYGWLYAANIIEQWTTPAGDAVDVIWNVSTSNPYRVMLLRTRIKP